MTVDEEARWAGPALSYFERWVRARPVDADAVVDAAPAILATARLGRRVGRERDVVRLCRAAEQPLILAGRWGLWSAVLDEEMRAADAVGDRAAQAWVLHQQGSRALCLDVLPKAVERLGAALAIREEIGDHEGALATRHNLHVADPTAAPAYGVKTRGPRGPRFPRFRWLRRLWSSGLAGRIITIVVASGLVAGSVGLGVALSHRHSSGGGPAAVTGSPTVVHFPNQQIGALSAEPRVVTLRNAANRPVTVTAVHLGGDGRSNFALGQACADSLPTELSPGETCLMTIAFRPLTRGPHIASLLAMTSSGTASIRVAGRGISKWGQRDPAQIEFGRQPLLTRSASARTVKVTNLGGAPLRLAVPFILQGSNRRDFSIDPTATACGPTLLPGQSCAVGFRFRPTKTGVRAARAFIVNSAGHVMPIRLRGTGIQKSAGGRTPPAIALAAEPPAVNFDSAGEMRSVKITNTGADSATLTTGSISIDQAGSRFSVVADACGRASLFPGESCLILARYDPSQSGSSSASLVVQPTQGQGVHVPFAEVVRQGSPLSDLAVDVSGPASVTRGEGTDFTIVVSNEGPSAASGVVVTDSIAGGILRTSPDCAGGAITQCVLTGSIPSGGHRTISLTEVAGIDATVLSNTVSVQGDQQDPAAANNGDSTSATVIEGPPPSPPSLTAEVTLTPPAEQRAVWGITVTIHGGGGTVSFHHSTCHVPDGQPCSSFDIPYDSTPVTIQFIPDTEGASFTWTGACDGASGITCTVDRPDVAAPTTSGSPSPEGGG